MATSPATSPATTRGGAWLLGTTRAEDTFTPEQRTPEQQLMADTASEFIARDVLPRQDEMEAKDWSVVRALMRRCGELGLLGVNVEEAYGGVNLDKVSSLVVSEHLATVASFAATFGAHSNLCVLPISLFGTDSQKQAYLPRLVSGEQVGAYALSESGSGSDAMAARTTATRQPDGSYLLSGEKMWITNGGFADVIIVFAKVDGEHFTAFIVEKQWPGVSSGKEEHKMGLHGSSTTPIVLQEVRVPATSVLGEVGKGHKVALNALNFGRFKLGAMCTGGAKTAIGQSARYAAERNQFGQPIARFGAIRQKLGAMTARTYAIESALYRTAGLIDVAVDGTSGVGAHDPRTTAAVLEDFAVEAAIAKVAGSEILDFVLDETVQIHGGNGYVRDYPAERSYRDARVNRIFEGTNEINRLLIPGLLVRRAVKGDLPLIAAARRLQAEITAPSLPASLPASSPASLPADDSPLALAALGVDAFKKVALMLVGTAMQTYGEALTDEQEVLCYVADVVIDTHLAESAVLRARRATLDGHPRAGLHADAAVLTVSEAALRIEAAARNALAAMAGGDALRTLHAALRRVLKPSLVNPVAVSRRLADATVAAGRYIFE